LQTPSVEPREWHFIVVRRLLEPGAWAAPFAILVAALLIRPAGDFSILDDFDYSATVQDFLRTGEIRLSDWPSMTLVGQVIWGAAFAKFIGPLQLSLRISTLTLHALGCLAAYCWLRGRDASPRLSAFAALAVATSPETLYFACTFMTDVPGLAWTLILLFAADRALESATRPSGLFAGVLGAIAYLFRQTAVIPLLAAILIALMHRRFRLAASMALPVITVAVAHHLWLKQHGVPHHASIPMLSPALLLNVSELAFRTARITATIALYIAPAALLFLPALKPRTWNGAAALRFFLIGSACVVAAAKLSAFVPYDGQTVFDMGLGADMSFDRAVFAGPSFVIFGCRVSASHVITVGAAILSLAILAAALPRPRRDPDSTSGLLSLSLLGTVLFAFISGSFYERYLLPAWSLAILGLAAYAPAPRRTAWIVLIAFSAWGVLGTEDYFRRFAVVWEALDDLLNRAPAATINGGMEFAGVHHFNPLFRGKPDRVRPYLSNLSDEARVDLILPMVLDPYTPYRLRQPFAVAYVLDDTKRVLKHFPYRSWLRTGVVHSLQRQRLPTPAGGS